MRAHRRPGRLAAWIAPLAVLSAGSLTAFAGDWPAWLDPEGRGDGNAVTDEVLPSVIDVERVAWRCSVGIGFSAVAVVGDRLFTMGHNGEKGPRGSGGRETVWCLNVADGEPVWQFDYEAPLLPNLHDGGPGATPVYHDGVLYTVSKDGRVHAFDADDGSVLWSLELMEETGMRRPPEWGYSASPVILGNWLLVESGATLALGRQSGAVAWRSDKFTPAYGTPTVFEHDGKTRIAVLKTEGLVILDGEPESAGRMIAFHPWETSFETNANTPIIVGGRIFLSTGYDRGCTLLDFDGATLTPVYENLTMCNHMGNAVLIDGHLYGFDGTAHRGREVELVCMEWATGQEVWRHRGLRYGTLIGAGTKLIVLSERGELLIGEATPGGWKPEHETQALGGRCWTMPVWANGRLHLRNSRGDLAALPLAAE